MTATVLVAAERPYQVHIGAGVNAQLTDVVSGASRVALLHPPVLAEVAARMADQLAEAGVQAVTIVTPVGEQAKTADTLVSCWHTLAEAGFTRNDLVVGLGGGATTDLAGFVAATWLRGVGFVSVPTTVLGMVDAAVGGKTGINIPAGKNLVGAFHEPRAVLCDLDLLAGLPPAEVRSGLAEVVKCGFIADPAILDIVEADAPSATQVDSAAFAELVRRAIEVKARVVTADLREATSAGRQVGREALNYGHTLGHAIEAAQHFRWRHGEAVAVGMVFAAELSRRELGLSDALVQRHRDVLASLGLPVRHDAGTFADLRALMALDKKARGNRLRFVGLADLAQVAIIDGPDDTVLADCHTTVSDAAGL